MAARREDQAAEGTAEPEISRKQVDSHTIDPEKGAGSQDGDPKNDSSDDLSLDAQAGVRAIQATTSVWSKWHLIAAYGL